MGWALRPKNTIVSCNLSLGCTKGKGACLTLNHNHRFIIIKHKLSPTLTYSISYVIGLLVELYG